MSLSGRTAIVTGAGRGIGFSIARLLCERGMQVAVNDIDSDTANKAAGQLTASGHRAIACPGDITKRENVLALFDSAESILGPLWLLVNNAGSYYASPAESFPEEAWDATFALDAKAVFVCSQEAVRRMSPRSAGRVVVVSSIAGMIVRTGQIAYCAAKAAAIHFSRCLAVEMASRGITVNCICPGMTDSAMLRQTAESRGVALEDYLAMIPSGKLAKPQDHAHLVAWLALEESAHVTGQVIAVDGAQSLYHPLTLGSCS